MNITLHIERLVLEGFDLSPQQRRILQNNLTAELVALVYGGGLRSEFITGAAVPSLPGAALRFAGGADAASFGKQIAHSIFSGIGGNSAGAQAVRNTAKPK